MTTIKINQEKCIKCRKCETICPVHLFSLKDGKMEVIPDKCIVCGHCVAICPPYAIDHGEFPENKVHPFDRNSLPSPESLDLLIKSRRSNRAFSNAEVPEEFLERIVEAAHRAPTASNLQQLEMIVVTDSEVLKSISQATVDKFYGLATMLYKPFIKPVLKPLMPANYRYVPEFLKMKKMLSEGNDPILRGAVAAIFFVTPKDCRFGCQDSNLAYQNASLMAEALGVAQFYTGFVCTVAGMDGRINKLLGIDGKIHAGMAIGMPKFKFDKYIDKKDIKVRYIR